MLGGACALDMTGLASVLGRACALDMTGLASSSWRGLPPATVPVTPGCQLVKVVVSPG